VDVVGVAGGVVEAAVLEAVVLVVVAVSVVAVSVVAVLVAAGEVAAEGFPVAAVASAAEVPRAHGDFIVVRV
jgi:hypothetical protein